MNRFSQLSLGTRLSLLVALSVAFVLVALTMLVHRQSGSAVEERAGTDLDTAAQVMLDAIALYDGTLTETTQRVAGGFRTALPAGEVKVDPKRTTRPAWAAARALSPRAPRRLRTHLKVHNTL